VDAVDRRSIGSRWGAPRDRRESRRPLGRRHTSPGVPRARLEDRGAGGEKSATEPDASDAYAALEARLASLRERLNAAEGIDRAVLDDAIEETA
jgi:transcription elongation GreA/GreB family factor